MERVTGIGGVFFRARDPEALTRWYTTHLGVSPPPPTYDDPDWWQQAGPTVFTALDADSSHFGRPEQDWSINFRVADLNAMIAQLTTAGITVSEPESHPNGRFAELADPEGNPIHVSPMGDMPRKRLWEPTPDTLNPPSQA